MIGSRAGIKREINSQTNGVYLAKSLSANEIEFYRQLVKNNHKLVVLDAEGAVFLKDMKEDIQFAFPESTLQYVDIFFVFGEEIKNVATKQVNGIDSSKIKVTGDPRFDLLKLKYRKYFSADVSKILKKYGQFVLINTNFPFHNHFTGTARFREYLRTNEEFDGALREILLNKVDYFEEIVPAYIDAIRTLSSEFNDLKFVVRPHPSENIETYVLGLAGFKNIHVVHKGNVVKWILASRAVIHYDCTTGIESALAEKIIYSYMPKSSEEFSPWLPVYVSKATESVETLCQFLNEDIYHKRLRSYQISEEKLEVISKFFANIDNEASPEIVKCIKSLEFNKASPRIVRKNQFELIKSRWYSSLRNTKNAIVKADQKSISLKKFSTITRKEITTKLNKLSEIEGFNFKFCLRIHGRDTAFIMKT